MSRKLSLVLSILTALVIVAAGFGYHLYQYYMFSKQVTIGDVALNSVEAEKNFGIPTGFVLEFSVNVRNPTPYVLDLERITYAIFIEEELVYEGAKQSITIPAETNTSIEVDLEISSAEILDTLWIIIQKGSLRYRVSGTVTVPVKLFGLIRAFTVSVPYDVNRTLPILSFTLSYRSIFSHATF